MRRRPAGVLELTVLFGATSQRGPAGAQSASRGDSNAESLRMPVAQVWRRAGRHRPNDSLGCNERIARTIPDMGCYICRGLAEVGPIHVVVHGFGDVCWACARERDSDDWGFDQFDALLARVLAVRDQRASEAGTGSSSAPFEGRPEV